MRALSFVILSTVVAAAYGFFVPTTGKYKVADREDLVKQKTIFEVLYHILQRDVYDEHYSIGQSYSIPENLDKYTNQTAVKEFLYYYKHGMLPKGEIFNIMNEKHQQEVISLFNVFYYAKDWDTFYKTIVWARDHVNGGMFVYALSVAVVHRDDLQGIELPSLYEIYPYHFVNSEVIQEAHRYKMEGIHGRVVIPANYSGWYVQTNEEQRISYFTEDIGLNSFFYNFHIDYPFWMGGEQFTLNKDRRGELCLYTIQQLLARYYLERLSNHLGDIPNLSSDYRSSTGYFPSLHHHNGLDFPVRHDEYSYGDFDPIQEYITEAQDYERRIRDTIDFGFVLLPDGSRFDLKQHNAINILGNLIQGNPDSYNTRFYKSFITIIKFLLGNSFGSIHDYAQYPSILETFHTSMRDPAFYQLYKKVVKYAYKYMSHLPAYTINELEFPGIRIENVEFDKLMTYFDSYEFDISSALYLNEEEIKRHGEGYNYVASQERLNHRPFTYMMTVASDKATDAVIRVFIGPKYDEYHNEINIEENRENFFQVDQFLYKIKSGKNIIERKSQDYTFTVKDRTSYYALYKQVMGALQNQGEFHFDNTEAHCGFPDRLVLPKGTSGGMQYQFFFVVSPYHAPAVPQFQGFDEIVSCGIGSGARYIDSLPLGYPFDRRIDETVFPTSNMYFKDVVIYHDSEYEKNVTH